MPYNTEHWDPMRQYEERMKELREDAEDEGIEVSEVSISNALSFLSAVTDATVHAQGEGSEPSRLLKHREETEPVDEWAIPPIGADNAEPHDALVQLFALV